jgi:hypothetical protein
MIEAGFVSLIQTGITNQSVNVPGGFAVQLPKDLITSTTTQAWAYRSILSVPTYLLNGQDPLTFWEVQIDSHGFTMANAITLSRSIDNVLRGGFKGTLSDPDNTVVQGIFRLPSFVDGFNDINRSFVRSTEYRISYVQI